MEPIDLLGAEHVGVKDMRLNLSRYVKGKAPVVVTEHGKPVKILISYKELLEMIKSNVHSSGS